MGKSTFSRKIALDWGAQILHIFKRNTSNEFQDVEVLAELVFLFHVTLRNSGKFCDLTEMITDQIISRIYLVDEVAAGKDTLLSVLSNRKCLILADGLDEWSHPCESNCSCTDEEKTAPFLYSKFDATVVITSRPWRMSQHRVKDSKIDRYLEIEGVADSKRLVQNVLGCLTGKTESEEKSKEFISFIKERELLNIMTVPIVVMMLVCLWFEGVGESYSLCEIYALMMNMMFGRKTLISHYRLQDNNHLPSCFQNAKHIFKNIPALLSTAKLAFEQLFSTDQKSALVFKQVKSISHEDKAIMLKTGILRETKSQSLIDHSSSFSFIHKTVQEFLADLHLSYNPDKLNRVVEPFYNRSGEISDISQVFIYICGLNSNIANQMSKMICDSLPASCTNVSECSNYVYTVDQPAYSVVYSIQRLIAKGHIEACVNNVTDLHLNLLFFIFDWRTDVSTLKTLLFMNKSQVRYLCVYAQEEEISKEEIQEVFSLSSDSLTTVKLISQGGRYDLSDCRKLNYLRIGGNGISEFSVNVNCLVTCKFNQPSPAVEKEVLHSLTSIANRCSSLKHLLLIDIKNIELFCRTLPQLTQIEYLYIGCTDLGDHVLHISRTISHVDLFQVTMTAGVFRELLDTMDESTHIVTLFLDKSTVTPCSEFETIKQYVQSCLKYTVLEDADQTFNLKRNI